MLSTYERNVAIRDSELSTALDYGYNQGMEQGLKQGMEQGINAIAKLIEQGVPLEETATHLAATSSKTSNQPTPNNCNIPCGSAFACASIAVEDCVKI